MRNYINGYSGKIEYYQYQLNKAIHNLDTKGIEFNTNKLIYFVNRQIQKEVYG